VKNLVRELFDATLDRLGVIKQKPDKAPLLNPRNQFTRDITATDLYHKRRLGISPGCESNADTLGYSIERKPRP
jgi:hypothetical protein